MELFMNPLLIIFILLMIFCIVRGAKKGMLRIIYGLISWILLLWFVNTACGYISDYLNVNTSIPTIMQEAILSNISERYEENEQTQQGTGIEGVVNILPYSVRERIDATIHDSVEATLRIISTELSETAIKGLSFIISILAGILLLFLLDKLIKLIGDLPGISEVNMMLGVITGFAEGILVTWLCMYIADCFSTSLYGQFVISNCNANLIMNYVYKFNVIERIIGI